MASIRPGVASARRAAEASRPAASAADVVAVPPSPSLHTALVCLDEFRLPAFFAELFRCYKWSLQQYPVYTKSITSATIAVIGEALASLIKYKLQPETRAADGTVVSLRRLGVFGLYGLVCTGPMLHYWYTLLEYILTAKMGLTGARKIAAKLLIDRALWGPPFVLFTISFLQLLQTLSPKKTAEGTAVPVCVLHLCSCCCCCCCCCSPDDAAVLTSHAFSPICYICSAFVPVALTIISPTPSFLLSLSF